MRLLFVLERSQDRRVYVGNLERSISRQDWIEAAVMPIEPVPTSWINRVPILGSWSVQASWRARSRVNRWLPGHPTDAIFIHTQVASLLIRRTMGRVPTVISLDATPKNYDSVGAGYGHQRGWRAVEWAKTQVNRRVYKAAAAFIAWSHWAAHSLIVEYGVRPERVHVIRPGVDLSVFHPLEPRPGPHRIRVLFVGDDFVRKGGPDVIAAMGRLSKLAELDIVTDSEVGPLQAGLVCRVHRDVAPQSPQLINLYQCADVFALPSSAECFGMAVAEALACGLPIVASPTGAVPEMVTDGVNGFLVPPRDPTRLGRALEALIETPSLRRSMGQKSYEVARKEHDAAANNEGILEVLAGAARPPRRREASS